MAEDDFNENLFDDEGNPTDEDPEYSSPSEWLDDMESLNYPNGIDED